MFHSSVARTSPAVSGSSELRPEGAADSGLLLTKALARLQPRAEQEASTWSLMPYQPEAGTACECLCV